MAIELERPPMTQAQALTAIWQMMYPDDTAAPSPDDVVEQLRMMLAQKDRELKEVAADAGEVLELREQNARWKAEIEQARSKPKRTKKV
jgi:hypothetical protein